MHLAKVELSITTENLTQMDHEKTRALIRVFEVINKSIQKNSIDILKLLYSMLTTSSTIELEVNSTDSADINKHVTKYNELISNINLNENEISNKYLNVNIKEVIPEEVIQTKQINKFKYDANHSRESNAEFVISNVNSPSEIGREVDSVVLKGRCGEMFLENILKQTGPGIVVNSVSTTHHVGDIHVVDKHNSILYVVESKMKKNISKKDIEKFESDVKTVSDNNNDYQHIFGIFVSLDTEHIPSIGSLTFNDKTVYLTKDFVKVDVFKLLFKAIPTMLSITDCNEQKTVDRLSPEFINVITQLRHYNIEQEAENMILHNIKNSTLAIVQDIANLETKVTVRRMLIKKISEELALNYEIKFNESDENILNNNEINKLVESNAKLSKQSPLTKIPASKISIELAEEELKKYLSKKTKNTIKKKELLSMPEFAPIHESLRKMKVDAILLKYKPGHKENIEKMLNEERMMMSESSVMDNRKRKCVKLPIYEDDDNSNSFDV